MAARPNRKVGQRVFHITTNNYITVGRIVAITDADLSVVWQPFLHARTYTYNLPEFWDHIVFCCNTL